ncbi:hypothetical protein [Clostridium lundense]|uniref:hypothetical protein n=1 Tax=Clostridium lundense TaxID=319475 RepID=UPI0004837E88|nr:hypothetical protein [Clostridium lundense]
MNKRNIDTSFKIIYILHVSILLVLSIGRFLIRSIFKEQIYKFIIYYCMIIISIVWITNPTLTLSNRKVGKSESFDTRIMGIMLMILMILKLIDLFM